MGHPPLHDDLPAADPEAEAEPRAGRVHGGRTNLRRLQGGHGPSQHDDEAHRPGQRRVLAPEQQHAQPEAQRHIQPQRGVSCFLGQRRLPRTDAAAAAAERRPVRPAGQRDARPCGGRGSGPLGGPLGGLGSQSPVRAASAASTAEWISCSAAAATTGLHAAAALAATNVATATAAAKPAQN